MAQPENVCPYPLRGNFGLTALRRALHGSPDGGSRAGPERMECRAGSGAELETMQQEGNQQGSAMDGLVPEAELWQQFSQTRDPDIREELVSRYLSFAKGLAMRYRGASESPDDL